MHLQAAQAQKQDLMVDNQYLHGQLETANQLLAAPDRPAIDTAMKETIQVGCAGSLGSAMDFKGSSCKLLLQSMPAGLLTRKGR